MEKGPALFEVSSLATLDPASLKLDRPCRCGGEMYRGARLKFDAERNVLEVFHIGGFLICPKCCAAWASPSVESEEALPP